MEPEGTGGRELLAAARDEYRNGSVRSAWESVRRVASIARRTGDVELLADAALLIGGPSFGAWDFAAQRHSLCQEALERLGDRDPARVDRLRTLLAVTRSPWRLDDDAAPTALDGPAAEARSQELHGRHAGAIGAAGVHVRLACADELAALAASTYRHEDAAWASLWRLDAYAQLGRRLEFNAEMMLLAARVRELGSPSWQWRLAAARASLALQDDHLDDLGPLAAEALRIGNAAGVEDAPFIDLVLRARAAVQARSGLDEVEAEVRQVLLGAPLFAQGWRAEILVARGHLDEAHAIWRALVPLLPEFPTDSTEWLIAMAGYAGICTALGDAATAPFLVEQLSPYADQHATGGVMAPYEGPVALFLGKLSALVGDHAAAREHLAAAAAASDRVHAPYFAAASHEALELVRRRGGPLTRRELDVARLVAGGLTNRQIAERLHLSERTVENHVGNILRKLDLSTRTAMAAHATVRAALTPSFPPPS